MRVWRGGWNCGRQFSQTVGGRAQWRVGGSAAVRREGWFGGGEGRREGGGGGGGGGGGAAKNRTFTEG